MSSRQLGTLAFASVLIVACGSTQAQFNSPSGGAIVPTEPARVEVKNAAASTELQGPCPAGMVLVEGDYCPIVRETCLSYVDGQGNVVPKPDNPQTARCAEFQAPTVCLSRPQDLVHKRFCIDEYEYPNHGGQRPQSWMTWYDAKRVLEAEGKRLCTPSEWTFACEGPEMHPYPYGDGYHRDRLTCNTDNPPTHQVDRAKRPGDAMSQELDALLVPSGDRAQCVSPFGVHDMPGNIDEWVDNTGGYKVSGLMGGHVFGVRTRCRAITDGHGPTFGWYETGTRGCKDVNF